MAQKLHGVLTPLITPFRADGEIDHKQLRALVDRSIDGGVHGVCVCGSSGEFQTLTSAERRQVVETVVEHTAGRVPVIAQTGALQTREALELTRHAHEVGADVAMVIAPFYDPLNLDAVKDYYRTVADSVEIPIMIYNIPSVTGVDVPVDTIGELARQCANIDYVKNTSPDMAKAVKLVHELGDLVTTFVGWDSLALSSFVEGVGVMAVTANVVPAQLVAVYDAVQAGDLVRAQRLWKNLYPFIGAIDAEPYIAAIKWCLDTSGLAGGPSRIASQPLTEASARRLAQLTSDALAQSHA